MEQIGVGGFIELGQPSGFHYAITRM